MIETVRPGDVIRCHGCGTELASTMLSCPRCQRLVHTERVQALVEQARGAEAVGRLTDALVAWRSAQELLPPSSRQYAVIAAKIAELGRGVDALPRSAAKPTSGGNRSSLGGLTAAATFVLLALSKGKVLLLGLTKVGTFYSMLLSLGLYWTAFGWELALGLIVSIYIHEMGHVVALARYGIRASAPMFIPGFGAVIRMKQYPGDPRQDARVGLAGPLWGLGAALAAALAFVAGGGSKWAAVAQLGGLINLFNLTPIWQLDGSRAFHSMTRNQRWLAAGALAVACAFTMSSTPDPRNLIVIITIVAAFQAWFGRPAKQADAGALGLYVFLVAAHSALMMIPVKF